MNEICSASPFSDTIKEEEIYPTLPDGLNGALDARMGRVKTYLKNSMYPLMYLFDKYFAETLRFRGILRLDTMYLAVLNIYIKMLC